MKHLIENFILVILFVVACTFFVLACNDNDETEPLDASVVDMVEAQEATVDVEVIEDQKEVEDLTEND